MLQLLVTANVVLSSLILSALMMESTHSSKKSVLTRSTRRHIVEDGILHSPKLYPIMSQINPLQSNIVSFLDLDLTIVTWKE
jgi:hypothetical protein